MPECPADGCDYTGVTQSVAAHYSGKRDQAHSGGYHDALSAMDSDDLDGGGSQDSETSSNTGSDDLQFPSNPDGTEPETKPEPNVMDPGECPGCGSLQIVDAAQMLRRRNDLKPAHMQLLRESDYVCTSCGGVFDDA